MGKARYIEALVAGLLLAILLAPLPARTASEALEWTPVDKPGRAGNIVVSPSEVSDIAVGLSSVLYAIDSENSKIYRSLDAGVSWEDITYYLVKAGAGLPASKIVVAPDDSAYVAVVTNGGTKVYWSNDGGIDWLDTGSFSPSLVGTIQAIDISPQYTQGSATYREIAIGTALWVNGTTDGQVWIRQMVGMGSMWQNQNLTVYPQSLSLPPSNGEVSALAYAPRYPSDPMLLVVASTSSDVATGPPVNYRNKTYLCLFKRDTLVWNSLPGYPVEIVAYGDGPGVSYINSSLALPSNYSSGNAASRQLFVSYDRSPSANDDVYWLNNTAVTRMNVLGGVNIDISSIAYYGTTNSGKLLAGDVHPVAGSKTVQVRRNTFDLTPSPTWQPSSVSPTGPGNARVGWSPDGTIAYCGTSQHPGVALDESAFSASLDGDKWRQLGLIDTVIKPADIVPAPDSKSLFVTTYNSFGPQGIWRSASEPLGRYWERLLTVDTTSNAVILRLSANYSYDYTMYAAEVGGNQIYVTHNRGNTWQKCLSAPGPIIDIIKVIDMAVKDEKTLYIALGDGYSGYISKSINSALTWQEPVSTNLPAINMFVLVGDKTILVGGQNGDVAYSSDGGESFTLIREVIGGGSGDVQVVADVNFKNNHIIYAASNIPGDGIWRWTIGVSKVWERIDASITDFENGQSIAGLAVGPEGTLYALSMEAATSTSGGVIRSLNPAEPDATKIEFDLVNDALPTGTTFNPTLLPTPTFPNHLPYLKLSGDAKQNELWTIDSANQIIYRFQDTLCKAVPKLVLPEAGQVIPIDSSGYVSSLMLQWNELAGATGYEAAIYLDSGATRRVWVGNTTTRVIIATGGSNPARLITGTTYYWRVRAVEPVRSPWSEIRSLEPALGAGEWDPFVNPARVVPIPGSYDTPIRPTFMWNPADWATGYEFELSKNADFSNPVWSFKGTNALKISTFAADKDLEYSTDYYWRVTAISATSKSKTAYGSFRTMAKPVAPAPAVQQAVTPSTSAIVVEAPTAAEYLPWIIVSIGAILFFALIVLIVRTRR